MKSRQRAGIQHVESRQMALQELIESRYSEQTAEF
jgi:hypothetical protein